MAIPITNVPLPRTGALAFGAARDTHTHNGLDLPAPEGTPVRAAAAGLVVYASLVYQMGFAGYGAHVAVSHPDLGAWTLYAHLSRVDVQVGELVVEGEVLGAVGRTAFTHADPTALIKGGPHLHFEASPTPYPQSNQAPRFAPIEWLLALGAPKGAPPFGPFRPFPEESPTAQRPSSRSPRPRSASPRPFDTSDDQCRVSTMRRCQLHAAHTGPHDFGENTEPGAE
jgi:murein DD-endopeptidase MepM/ murein hydrolase activator NlpD